MKKLSITLLILILIFGGPLLVILKGKVDFKADYRTANRDSTNLAPKAQDYKPAIIQAYAARAFNWRGAFGVHTWIALKSENAQEYTIYQVLGWRAYQGLPVVDVKQDIADRNWFNQTPEIFLDIRGVEAQKLIAKIQGAADSYPYADKYDVWPGPNSNTFIAHIGRSVPELKLTMPSNAVGKDYKPLSRIIAKATSATGYQLSIFGLFGITVAKKEGIEVNILGLVYGIKFKPFKFLLPGF
jgi:uncharacterized protein YxeA